MDYSAFLTANLFVHGALACYVAGFAVRDELILRLFVTVGSTLYILYYYFISDSPLWDAIWASAVIAGINVLMSLVILRERSTIGMSAPMRQLYEAFPTLNPGQFRKIMRDADWRTAERETELCTRGAPLDHLYFVTKGAVYVERGGKRSRVEAGNFIGEISFLIGGEATARVVAPEGTEYVVWSRKRLGEMMKKSLRLSNALSALFNTDIARKLSVSAPELSVMLDTHAQDRSGAAERLH
jgi:hypothetical protein